MAVGVVVQARMSSSRFPGKMLAKIAGQPQIGLVLQRALAAKRVEKVILATSEESSDDVLAETARGFGVEAYRGPLDDVLGRVCGAARKAGLTTVVRVTGDCPLLDPEILDAMLARFAEGDVDYLSNVSPPSFPDGLDVEVLSFAALETADRDAKGKHAREHVTVFVREHPEQFRLANFANPEGNESHLRLTVDSPEDLALVDTILGRADRPLPVLADVRRVLAGDDDLRQRATRGARNTSAVKTLLADLERDKPRPVITKSNALWERGQALMPAGTQTLSKGPSQFVRGFAPKYIERGQGSHVWDVDGNEYIDYPMGLGAVTLGHGHPAVVEAVTRQIAHGTVFSMMHPLEVTLAERITKMVPCADQIRFGKNGSDATSACIRASRALTGRTHVARCGYHGWQDWSIDQTYGVRSKGVPEETMRLTHPFTYNDLASLERVLEAHPCAAVILEPVSVTPPAPGFLEGVRALATRFGAVLVFDEVITGFRYARGGAQEHFGVTPDLASMGKGLANGMPLSIVVGKREFMRAFDEIFFSFTFGGETASLAAAGAVLDVMERENYWAHAWRLGEKLQTGYREAAKRHRLEAVTDCAGMPPWTIATFLEAGGATGLEVKTLFQQEMFRNGILFSGSQFVSMSHTDADIDKTLAAYEAAMRVLRFAIDSSAVKETLLGEPIELVFRRV